MSFLDHQGESEFPFNKETVFNAMVKAIPTVKGMTIDNADKLQNRIVVKAGVSLMSWGENIPIQLSEIYENLTKVKITSTPKTGIMFGGAFDLGKNRNNIERILSATSIILSNQNTSNIETFQTIEYKTSNNQNFNNLKLGEITKHNQTKKWYDNKFIVHLLLLIFFPIGLYALWKTNIIAKWWKITVTVLIGLIVISNIGDDETSSNFSEINNYSKTKKNNLKVKLTQIQKDSIVEIQKKEQEQKDKIKSIKKEIIIRLKKRAKRDWPNDYTTQEYWINEQVEAYEYMLTIKDNSIKKQAQRDWPIDFTTQKYWYNEQIKAKQRLK